MRLGRCRLAQILGGVPWSSEPVTDADFIVQAGLSTILDARDSSNQWLGSESFRGVLSDSSRPSGAPEASVRPIVGRSVLGVCGSHRAVYSSPECVWILRRLES
jgi:hypothetical protein